MSDTGRLGVEGEENVEIDGLSAWFAVGWCFFSSGYICPPRKGA